MTLYHGSNVVVQTPRLLKSDRKLDFGNGFYLTSSYEQAAKWSLLTAKRRGTGGPCITVYDFVENDKLSTLKFDEPNSAWLRYITDNRKGNPIYDFYDIVFGPVANDKTMPVLNLYFSGIYTEEEAIRRLLPQKLKNQYAFKTAAALKCLRFLEAKKL